MATTTTDLQSIIDDAAGKLEARYAEIQEQLQPLQEEQREIAEAIYRIVGSYPEGYRQKPVGQPRASANTGSATGSTRERLSPEEREQQVLQVVNEHPEGISGKAVASELGVSTATATKAINALIERNEIKSEGERKNRKLYPA